MIKLIITIVLMTYSFSSDANQKVDSFYVHLYFREGFFIGKKLQIKVNNEIIYSARLKTIRREGHCFASYGFKFTLKDEITVKIGLFQHKLNKDKILSGYRYVSVNRFLLFNEYSYHKRPALYD